MSTSEAGGEELDPEGNKWSFGIPGLSSASNEPKNLEATPRVHETQDPKPEEPLEGPNTFHPLPVLEPEPQALVMAQMSASARSGSHRRWDAEQQECDVSVLGAGPFRSQLLWPSVVGAEGEAFSPPL